MEEEKMCSKCLVIKPIKEFHKTSRKYGGKKYEYTHAKCKVCRNDEKKEYYKDNISPIQSKMRDYYSSHTALFRSYYTKRKENKECQKKNNV